MGTTTSQKISLPQAREITKKQQALIKQFNKDAKKCANDKLAQYGLKI